MRNPSGSRARLALFIAVPIALAFCFALAKSRSTRLRENASAPSSPVVPYVQEDERFTSRAAFDAGVEKCLQRLQGREPFIVDAMIMESKMRFREPSPRYLGLGFEAMKQRARQLLATRDIESISVFVTTTPEGPGARLSWVDEVGIITYSNTAFTPAGMKETIRQRRQGDANTP